ncbi:L,D-transpeptidase family protein [Sulfobacillus harzensis]|nr:L,D-transpeptidase family protein [Sulfobacillus harzensis]
MKRWLIIGVIGLAVVWIAGMSSLGMVAHTARAQSIHTKIIINVLKRRLYLYRNNHLFQVYPVAVGKPSTPSPRGEFTIIQKAVWGDGFGTRWMRISTPWGIYGIHGTDKPWSVGTVASHGCFRMYNRDVEQVYTLVKVGTSVIVEGITPYTRIRRPLKPGTIGQDVVELQRLLRLAKVYRGSLSGVYNSDVEAAVKKFQEMVGVSPTGSASLETTKKLLEYTHQTAEKPGYLTRAGS